MGKQANPTKGRPSSYSDALGLTICERLADGESAREICRDPEMPGRSTLHRWLIANESFRDQYARAREAQADHFVDEIIEIADDATNDWMERQQGDETVRVIDHEHISRSKLRVDARKWVAAKTAPKKYGDSAKLTLAGDAENPVQIISDRPMSVDEWEATYCKESSSTSSSVGS